MKYFDIKPVPTDEYTLWVEMKNRVIARQVSMAGKKIKVL